MSVAARETACDLQIGFLVPPHVQVAEPFAAANPRAKQAQGTGGVSAARRTWNVRSHKEVPTCRQGSSGIALAPAPRREAYARQRRQAGRIDRASELQREIGTLRIRRTDVEIYRQRS